jgi:hypothetical protein
MVFPNVKLHHLYSLNLYEGLDIIFEDLNMINMPNLKEAFKKSGIIHVVDKQLTIDTVNCVITLNGYKINKNTYIINKDGSGDVMFIKYKCSNDDIVTGIEYLYHMNNTKSAN